MAGIKDGRLLEVQSVPLDRLEVDVATQSELNNAVDIINNSLDGLDTRVTVLEGYDHDAFAAHLLEPIATAHSGEIDVENQIPNISLGEHKMAFTVLHLGTGPTNAATGNHTHLVASITDFSPSDYVRKTGSIAETVTGVKTFSDNVVIQGNLTINGTTTTVNSENMAVDDNEIVLNSQESGAGVSTGSAGLRIERGTANDYLIQFQESDDTLRAGFAGSTLKQVAFIEDVTGAITASDVTDAGSSTFAGNSAFRTITMSKDMGTTYDISVTPKLAAAGDVSALGTWYWVRVDNSTFRVYNTGSDAITGFSWIARK